jgi:hypothetical protein
MEIPAAPAVTSVATIVGDSAAASSPQRAPTISQPAGEETKAEAQAGNSGDAHIAVKLPLPKGRRGRPQEISEERKELALKLKETQGKKDNRAVARILYETHNPTTQQSRSVTTILRYYAKNQRSKYLEALASESRSNKP